MRDPRNPFRMLAAEYIAPDAVFLRLFGPAVLEILPQADLFDRFHIFQSTPGGGKTSLMRLFTPNCLLTLHAHRSNGEYMDLYNRLREMEVLDESGPRVLGVMISCAKNYAALEDMEGDNTRKDRLFFSLLNARIVLTALRGAMVLGRFEYPRDISKLKVRIAHDMAERLGLTEAATGQQLYDWGRKIENGICEITDSLAPSPPVLTTGHDGLHAFEILRPEGMTVDGGHLCDRVLVMLDDVHKLASRQRQLLLRELLSLRSIASVWIAERLEALGSSELLDVGAIENRDYGHVVRLESFWRQSSKRFESAARDIADRRARAASDVEIPSFEDCLQDTLDGTEYSTRLQGALDVVVQRTQQMAGSGNRFKEWLTARQSLEGTTREKLVTWRTTEILIERERNRQQLALDMSLSPEELERKDDSAVRTSAEMFVKSEFGLPYYFGFPRIAAIASWNIEQFLRVSGEVFEEAAAAALVKRPHDISPDRQERIVRKLASHWWDREIARGIPYSQEVRALVGAIGRYARSETYRSNAPYAPGVTGIAITMDDREKLRDPSFLKKRPDAKRLADVLSVCLAHNLLEPAPSRSQGYRLWMLMYLNRLLCVHFELPLQYGGWRAKTIDELCLWLQGGFKAARNGDRLR